MGRSLDLWDVTHCHVVIDAGNLVEDVPECLDQHVVDKGQNEGNRPKGDPANNSVLVPAAVTGLSTIQEIAFTSNAKSEITKYAASPAIASQIVFL